jgi:hypothetical protein
VRQRGVAAVLTDKAVASDADAHRPGVGLPALTFRLLHASVAMQASVVER